ncbi:hypothetical protein B4U79_16220 [Dinothrombium tinctorium]|uniref:N-acetyltransferase domain-containing protein n=1 Tax=Dinothrombium tinctorium TaxID=1965070 RepID=A0A3S3QAN1_9ACAR|nr:hypothetical protein B4U79_16220 [Dinothrombium tinctorium]
MSRNLIIRSLENNDIDEVAKLCAKIFCEREPLTRFLKTDQNKFLNYAKELCVECCNEKLSFVCEDRVNSEKPEIVGFHLCEKFKIPTKEDYDSEKMGFEINALLTSLTEEWIKLHSELVGNVEKRNKIIYVEMIGIKEGYEGFGIATKLMKAALNNAKSLGYETAVIIASAVGTQTIVEKKIPWKEMLSLAYDDFTFRGRKPFLGIESPKNVKVFELNLKDWEIN